MERYGETKEHEAGESASEEKMEHVFDVPSENLSEYFGTTTVKDFPTANPENVLRANAALKQQRGR